MWKLLSCFFLLRMLCASSQNISQEFNEEVLQVEENKKKNLTDCFFTLTGTMQSIEMEKFNNLTKNCTWVINPEIKNKTAQIRVFLHSLFLHEDDVLSIYKDLNDIGNESLRISDPIHAQNGSVTIITGLESLVMTLNGTYHNFIRKFSGIYHAIDGTFPLTPDVQILNSPIFVELNGKDPDITYTYSETLPHTHKPTFVFEEFKMASSKVSIEHGSINGIYNNVPPMDFFPTGNPMKINVEMTVGANDSFRLKVHMIDIACSQYHKVEGTEVKGYNFQSPPQVLNNGSMLTECRWIFEANDKTDVLGIVFENLHFDSALDIIAINDGASELSPPLLQITTSDSNFTKNKFVRTTGPYMWIAFKPLTYAAKLSANITVHGQGGYQKGTGTITVNPTVGNDTVFLLEVDENEVVLLNFTNSDFELPATLSVYDGFDKSHLLTTLHGNVWYPVLSKTSKMMLTATNFNKGSFKANFKGASPGCLHMSTASNENYVLSGNCNATCFWVVPPQDRSDAVLLLNLQFISLSNQDLIEIYRLDAAQTHIGTIHANVTHVPQISLAPSIGALIEIIRGPCQKESSDVAVIGQSSYVPACGGNLSFVPLTQFQITTPLYPDTYPILSNCRWKLSAVKGQLIHLAFHTLNLAPNHCVKVINVTNNNTLQLEGNQLPDDLFLSEESVVEFDSSNCGSKRVANSLVSSEGFVLNGTVADCGGVFSEKTSGEFTVPANITLCIWKISVPETNADANADVNIISYTISKKDDKGNYDFQVFDGASVRDSPIVNNSNSEIWSRTNSLIFIYKRNDASKPSAILSVKFSTISCNSSNQCDNKICLHPDWRCNVINECGDFSDERNCAPVPIPPEIKYTGYTPLAFWLTIFIMLALGVIAGIGIPHMYQKYQNGQYRRFESVIE